MGTGKDVTGGLSLRGADAGNYTVNGSHTDKADITALGITGTFAAADKVYDGNDGPRPTVARWSARSTATRSA